MGNATKDAPFRLFDEHWVGVSRLNGIDMHRRLTARSEVDHRIEYDDRASSACVLAHLVDF